MRTTLLVFSTLAILAACAQDGTTTPTSQSRSPNAGASQDVAPNGQGQAGANKSTPFSTITQVNSAEVSWDGVGKIYGAAIATCPAGSHVTGGGYVLYGGADVTIMYNAPFPGQAWRIYGVSHSPATITAYALCAQ